MIEVWWQAARQTLDKSEFDALFLAHYEGIYRLLFRIIGSPEEAEDLAQETFLRLYRQRFPKGREHNVRAWLYKVATNLAYNALRGRRRRVRREEMVQRQAEPAGETDPVETALRRDERTAVRQVLTGLPRRQARLLLLYYTGLSYRELADVLGVAPGSVGTLLARAKTAFEMAYRASLARSGGSDEM